MKKLEAVRQMTLFLNGEEVLSSCDTAEIWEAIGQSWSIYEVCYDDTGELVPEFIPY